MISKRFIKKKMPARIVAFVLCFLMVLGFTQGALTALAAVISPKAVLTTLTYDGFELDGFKSGVFKGTSSTGGIYRDTMEFKVTLSAGTTTPPTVAATAEEGVVVDITQAANLSNENEATVTVSEGGTTNYYKIKFTPNTIPVDSYLAYDYNDGNAGTYSNTDRLTATVENGVLNLAVNAPGWVHRTDGATYNQNDVMMRARLLSSIDQPRFGFHLRQKDANNLVGFHFNSANWNWGGINGGSEGWSANIGANPIYKNIWYDVAFQIKGNIATLWVNGNKLGENDLSTALNNNGYYAGEASNSGAYRFGFRSWYNAQTVLIDDWSVSPASDVAPPATSAVKEMPDPAEGTFETLSTPEMQVLVSKDFPIVFKYNDGEGNFLANGNHPWDAPFMQKMTVNARTINVTATARKVGDNQMTYSIAGKDGDDIDFTMDAVLKAEKNTLKLEFKNIVEKGDTFISTFGLYDNKMVSLMGADAKAATGIVQSWGPVADRFIRLDESAASRQSQVSYALLNDDNVAVGIYNNAEDAARKYIIDEILDNQGGATADKTLAVSNNVFYWHFYNKASIIPPDYVPSSTVIIGGEMNELDAQGEPEAGSSIDWQDAGLLYRQIAKTPFGGEDVKNYWNYIVFNMSGTATNPSETILDRAKAISYVTDGFGQKVMNKGYQVGGHDDSHGDYKNVSAQQGGAAGFEYLNKIGAKYNVQTGIHINATEFALDGFETELENMRGYPNGLEKNWEWLDQAYLVDKPKDIINGDLERRLNDLKTTLPNLSWIYVDVYQSGSGYSAKQLAHFINKNGWSLATEAAGDFEEDTTFLHWNTDLYYAVGGTQSQVIRFLQNDIADKFAPDRAILGMTMPSPAGWRGKEMFSESEEVFYRNNLATKYLQHFELQKWTINESAKFSGGVSTNVADEQGKKIMTLTRDGKTYAKIDVSNIEDHADYSKGNAPRKTSGAEIFIPWDPQTEEKIYYFNDYNPESTWELPASWNGVTSVYQYKLTHTGREFVGAITPSNGSVTVTGDLATPYILTKTQQATGGLGANRLPEAAGTWGEGSAIKNFGFTGQLEGWQTQGDVSITTVPTYGNGSNLVDYKDPLVSFGENGGSISQNLKLEAGKTYTLSTWTHTENRKATLTVTAGGKTFENYLTKNTTQVVSQPNKFYRMNYERIQIDFKMPQGVTDAVLTYSVAPGAGQSVADDFRCWKWQTEPTRTPSANEVIFDDFENVDAGYGPFVSALGGESHQHLAQKNIAAPMTQVKNYVIDGQWSFKDQQDTVATTLRTTTSSVRFTPEHNYLVEFDYMAYAESILGATAGYTEQSQQDFYKLEVRNAAGTVLQSKTLPRSTVTATGFNARPSVEKASVALVAPAEDTYISISRVAMNEINEKKDVIRLNMISIDNFRVTTTDGIEIDSVTAENGAAKVTFAGSLDVKDISLNQLSAKLYINNMMAVANLPLSNLTANAADKSVSVTFDKVPVALGGQNVRIEITYNGLTAKSASFYVAPEQPYYAKPADKTVKKGAAHGLTDKLTVRLPSAAEVVMNVTYTGYDANTVGVQTVTGTIDTGIHVMPADFSKTFTVKVTVQPVAPYYTAPADASVDYGAQNPLSSTIEIVLADGTKATANVTYTGYDANKSGKQTVTGTIDVSKLNVADDFANTFTVSVTVGEQSKKGCKGAADAQNAAAVAVVLALVGGAVLVTKRKKA